DLFVLEHACGEARIAPLWQIPHRDLFDIFNWQSLETLARRFAPDRVPTWEREYERRWTGAAKRYGRTSHECFLAEKMAKARLDVQRTYAVFRAQLNPPPV